MEIIDPLINLLILSNNHCSHPSSPSPKDGEETWRLPLSSKKLLYSNINRVAVGGKLDGAQPAEKTDKQGALLPNQFLNLLTSLVCHHLVIDLLTHIF